MNILMTPSNLDAGSLKRLRITSGSGYALVSAILNIPSLSIKNDLSFKNLKTIHGPTPQQPLRKMPLSLETEKKNIKIPKVSSPLAKLLCNHGLLWLLLLQFLSHIFNPPDLVHFRTAADKWQGFSKKGIKIFWETPKNLTFQMDLFCSILSISFVRRWLSEKRFFVGFSKSPWWYSGRFHTGYVGATRVDHNTILKMVKKYESKFQNIRTFGFEIQKSWGRPTSFCRLDGEWTWKP